ncbi:uncharacterized protein V1513DRAFT_386497 [Lipomyces chichibuensis]|uniref:uncharacterized protein n=1 Tax=Lipomyces chichibuensis TaxID=1546026 RepID=UPI003342FE52
MSIVKVHLCLITGDQPAIAKLMCLKGHNAKRPCRFCLIEGVVATNKQNYYPFLSLSPDSRGIRQLNLRKSMKEDIEDCHRLQDPTLYQTLGISSRSPLLDVRTLHWPESFPIDVMHLVLEGIVPRTFVRWVEMAKPTKLHLAGLGADIKESGSEVPAALSPSPEDVYRHYRSYRAQNWFDFLQLFVHPLLDGRASIEVRKNIAAASPNILGFDARGDFPGRYWIFGCSSP